MAKRANWAMYAVIDQEGRAGDVDAARRVLGGVRPQAGEAASRAADATPLYGLEGAFRAVRKAALRDEIELADLEEFVELGDAITSSVQEADSTTRRGVRWTGRSATSRKSSRCSQKVGLKRTKR